MLPFTTPAEHVASFAQRTMVRMAEARLDRTVDVVGTALDDAGRARAATAGTLVLVSGYAGTELGLQPLARSAVRDGIATLTCGIPDHGLAPLADAARGLDELLREAVPSGPIHLAGHSKGGPVILEWWRTATPDQRARVASVSLLASTPVGQRAPAGMSLVRTIAELSGGHFTKTMFELGEHTPTMRRIAGLDVPAHTRALSVISAKDGLISTDEAAWTGARNLVIEGPDAPDHMDTLADARVYEALRANVLGT